MASGIFAISLNPTLSPNPFPPSDTLSGTYVNPGSVTTPTILTATVGRYLNNPEFTGISIVTNGLNGGSRRSSICFGSDVVGKKVKIYFTFGNTPFTYELQIWGEGCFILNNPGGSGPSTPNDVTFGNLVPIFGQFSEPDLPTPPPDHNPFSPWLKVEIKQDITECVKSDVIQVNIIVTPTVNLISATVLKDSVNTGVTLTQLLLGVTFTDHGEYEVDIVYRYLGDSINPPSTQDETLIRYFSISKAPFPHMQRESRVYGYFVPGDPMLFDNVLVDNSTIDYNMLNGKFTLRFCGYYFIKWFIVTRSSYAIDGIDFAIAINGSTNIIGSNHVDVASTAGFSIVKVDGVPPIIQLVNTSNGIVFLSEAAQVVSGIVIFKIGDIE